MTATRARVHARRLRASAVAAAIVLVALGLLLAPAAVLMAVRSRIVICFSLANRPPPARAPVPG